MVGGAVGGRRSSGPAGRLPAVLLAAALVVAGASAAVLRSAAPASAAVPAGFTETVAFSGLVQPTAVRFAPDGRIFVAEKRGTVEMFDGLADASPTRIADLRTEVHNFWDRGLLGLAIDPGFPARPYLYLLYTFDGPIGGAAPRWGTAGADSDGCPSPPGATGDGCVVSAKLARLTLSGTTTTKTDLVHDWCQQYPSHSVGDLVFGRDGALYASAGDGASFNFVDYGQDGAPTNPCGDPPTGAGTALTPPTAQGGALRAQDLRTPADPVTLDGTVIRVSPDTGAALPDNPASAATSANARRIVAYGLRNPFRLSPRPGTDEVWIGDVGWNTWEEVNRLVDPRAGVANFGWPCYEGNDRQPGYDAADLTLCENLYAAGTADTKPYFPYRHGQPLNASDNCNATAGSSTSGISFSFYSGGPYPPEYDGALFLADYSRNCIWAMTRGTNGLPDRVKTKPFVSGAASPVDLETSPRGELFYADLNGGTIRRIGYGSGPSSCPAGQYLAEYFPNTTLAGTPTVRTCEAAPLDRDWGTGAPGGVATDSVSARWTGTFDFPVEDAYTFTATSDDGIRVWVDGVPLIDQWQAQTVTTFSATRTLAAGPHVVRVEWFERAGVAVARLTWRGGDAPPQPLITSPAEGTTWQVGDALAVSGSATDAEDGVLPGTALTWQVILQHCPAACHAHPLQSFTGESGSFPAPDHEYPSYLELRLTATDSAGQVATVSRRLDPRTAQVTLASQPAGLQLTLGQRTAVAPVTGTVVVGGSASVSAPSPQVLSGRTYQFGRWSDGGARSHNVTAPATAVTYTATYVLTGCPAGQYLAQYFANRTLTGAAATTRCEAAPLNQNWAAGAAPGTAADNFSARWSGSFTFPAGSRTFTATSDDGIRVWLDGTLIIDRWAGPGTTLATRSLTAGTHTVRVDYWEGPGNAYARLAW